MPTIIPFRKEVFRLKPHLWIGVIAAVLTAFLLLGYMVFGPHSPYAQKPNYGIEQEG
ncbi:MAG: hypothetical protein AAGI38_10305 [Bacteroidota bacterium]